MHITNERYKNTSASVSSGNNNADDIEICLSCYAHPRLDDCELVKRIEKHRLKFLDNRNCQECNSEQAQRYNEILNKGEIFTTLEHYRDLDDSVKLSNISEQASCRHDNHDNQKLRERFKKIFQDLEAAINDKTYSVNLKNEFTAIEYLKSQGYQIENFSDIENDDLDELGSESKLIIHLPRGRISTIENEVAAINMLSNRPVICNMDKKFFVVLRDNKMEVMKEK